MKRKLFLSLTLAALLSIAASAHAPKKVELKYNLAKGELTVDINHPVKDVADHYIEYLLITVNGEEVKKVDYTKQTSKEKEDAVIALPGLSVGDEIEVKAKCNKLGAKSGSIEVK